MVLPSVVKMRKFRIAPIEVRKLTIGNPARTNILQYPDALENAGLLMPTVAVEKFQDAELHIPGNERLPDEDERHVSVNMTQYF